MISDESGGKPNGIHSELARKLQEKEQQRQHIIAINRQASTPVVADLNRAGFQVQWVSDLFNERKNYKNAIPILLQWLPNMDNLDVKEEIVRALSVPWAKPIAAPAMIAEFKKLQDESDAGIKWAIGNALSVVADDKVFNEIVELVQDPHNGISRQMMVIALGNMKDLHAEEVLIGLLGDEEVVGHAIIALGKLKSQKAYPELERFLSHPKTWIRKAAKQALARIDKTKMAK